MVEEDKEEITGDCFNIACINISGKVDDLDAPEAAAVGLYVRFLKRIGSHSRNIVTSIINPFHRIGYSEKKKK